MERNNCITFLAEVDRAMKSADRTAALERLFRRWVDEPTPGEGSHFQAFIGEIRTQWETESPTGSEPTSETAPFFLMDVFRNDEVFARDLKVVMGETTVIEDVVPDDYALRHRSGLLLWKKRLEPKHLIWTEARPGDPFPLAASTEDVALRDTTFEERLEDLGLWVRVHPGMSRGRLSVAFMEP